MQSQLLCYDAGTPWSMGEKIVTKSEVEREICPFTLELCEECCEPKISGTCSFTLEPCHYYLTACLRHRNN
jgi:hypothetical protein